MLILTLVLRFYFYEGKKAHTSLSRRTTNMFVSNCTVEFSTMSSSKKVIERTTDNRK